MTTGRVPIAVRELPPDPARRKSRGSWQVIRVLVYPSAEDGLRRVSVALIRDNGRTPTLTRMETLEVIPAPGLETAEDLADFIVQALS